MKAILTRALLTGLCGTMGLLLAVLAHAGAPVAAAWTATDTASGSGLSTSVETWEASTVDFDGDGDEDVWIGYHDQGGKLWRNDGTGRYVRAAANAWPPVGSGGEILDRHYCAWADVDANGLVDTYCAAGRGNQNDVKHGKDNELWLQGPAGQFTDVGTQWGLGELCGRSHYVAFLHANGDAFPDLFVGNAPPRAVTGDPCDDPGNGLPNEESKLYLNQAGVSMRYAPSRGIRGNGGTRCAVVTDINGDGWDDLLVCGGTATKVYRNNGGTGFTDVAARDGLAVSHTDLDLADLDGDGDHDLITAAWGRFDYRLNTGGRFGAARQLLSVPGNGGRAVSTGDADGDGDPDVYALVSNVPSGTNPNDFVLRNSALTFTKVPVPSAGGIGDAVTTLDGNDDGVAEFLVLNGVETSGPVQRIELRFQ